MGDYQVMYGEQAIVFSVRRCANLNKKVAIHVQPDQRVVVDAPTGTSVPEIKAAMLKRARWVTNQLTQLEKVHRHALPREYVSGETHWYMGKRYLLKVKPSKANNVSAKLQGGMLVIATPSKEPDVIKEALSKWYSKQAQRIFGRRLDATYPTLVWIKHRPDWRLWPMKKQWGSCSPKGRLSLNPMLVKAPRDCIDYVIMHELCHLKHHNHSEAFYRLLASRIPNWKTTKRRLDNFSEVYLA